jgi:hypothetical protein
MTTTTNKEGPGKRPSKNDSKKVLNTPSGVEHRRRMREKLLALGKDLGFKEGRLDGAIIWIPEETDIMRHPFRRRFWRLLRNPRNIP